jgi:phytoene dehydrogenase-like protein
MAEKRDAIVVGAGLGGLTAAAGLVHAGLDVLVLDKNPHLGGTAALYEKRGFLFPMGPLGFSNPVLVEHVLESVGAEPDMTVRPVDFNLMAFGIETALALPYPDLIDSLGHDFPSERAGLARFFGDLTTMIEEIRTARARGAEPRLRGMEQLPSGDYVEGLVTDWRLRRILGSIGTDEPRFPLPLLAALWDLLSNIGIFHPAEGMEALTTSLKRAVTEAGPFRAESEPAGAGGTVGQSPGEIRLGLEVEKIVVDAGKVRGVTVVGGELVEAPAVISNADFKTTFLVLLDTADLPAEWLRAVAGARLTPSGFHVSLGVDRKKVDLSSFDPAGRIIYRGGGEDGGVDGGEVAGLDWSAPEIDPGALASQELEVVLYSADLARSAPAGGAVVLIRTTADHEHFARFRPARGKRLPGYLEYKSRLARALIEEVSKLIPGLTRAVSTIDIATPLTYEERAGRFGGAVAGWSQDFHHNRDYIVRELIRTPVSGLFMAGHQAYSWLFLGGIPTAIETGMKAAEAVLAGAGPATDIGIPA